MSTAVAGIDVSTHGRGTTIENVVESAAMTSLDGKTPKGADEGGSERRAGPQMTLQGLVVVDAGDGLPLL